MLKEDVLLVQTDVSNVLVQFNAYNAYKVLDLMLKIFNANLYNQYVNKTKF